MRKARVLREFYVFAARNFQFQVVSKEKSLFHASFHSFLPPPPANYSPGFHTARKSLEFSSLNRYGAIEPEIVGPVPSQIQWRLYSTKKRQKKTGNSPPEDKPHVPDYKTPPTANQCAIQVPEGVTVRQFALLLGQKLPNVQLAVGGLGEDDSPDSLLSEDVAELVAMEFGRSVVRKPAVGGSRERGSEGAEQGHDLPPRAPVVTVMGHVDHGKTTLLDALRKTNVALKEAGGITQHIGAFEVTMPGGGARITFLDTPGHAAFQSMRARGARATDVVVLVVAADDGVMAQTREALRHAREAGVAIVVAVTKCDKKGANPKKARQELLTEGVELEEVGGDVQVVEVSAVSGAGLLALEEAILFQAELAGLRARTTGPARAVVLEARMDKGQGPLATVLVQEGTLSVGDPIVVGTNWGKVKSMRDSIGQRVPRAGPSVPVEVSGIKGVPEAGDELLRVLTEERARQVASARETAAQSTRLQQRASTAASDAACAASSAASGAELPAASEAVVVVKTDVHGTMQAICQALEGLTCDQVRVRVVHCGVGPISQSDVALAEATGARALIAFNVGRAPASLAPQLERARLPVVCHRVIYHLLEEVGEILVGIARGTTVRQLAGQASVLQVFPLKAKKGPPSVIAGCRVTEGKFEVGQLVRVLRSGDQVFEGKCASMRREKKEVERVESGTECGIVLDGFDEFLSGDVLEATVEVVKKPKLVSSKETGEMRIVEA